MSATLKVTHKSVGARVRRGAYDVVVDGERVGSVAMNDNDGSTGRSRDVIWCRCATD